MADIVNTYFYISLEGSEWMQKNSDTGAYVPDCLSSVVVN